MLSKKNRSRVLALTLLALSLPRPAAAREEAGEVLVAKDVVFALELLSSLDSKTSQKGDKFDCKVLSPVRYAGAIISGSAGTAEEKIQAFRDNGIGVAQRPLDVVALIQERL